MADVVTFSHGSPSPETVEGRLELEVLQLVSSGGMMPASEPLMALTLIMNRIAFPL
jgi:hypothetical protein